jgi:hypothetical protein
VLAEEQNRGTAPVRGEPCVQGRAADVTRDPAKRVCRVGPDTHRFGERMMPRMGMSHCEYRGALDRPSEELLIVRFARAAHFRAVSDAAVEDLDLQLPPQAVEPVILGERGGRWRHVGRTRSRRPWAGRETNTAVEADLTARGVAGVFVQPGLVGGHASYSA